jgi:hypothetical protein
LIKLSFLPVSAQKEMKDSVVINNNMIESIVSYSAKDTIYADIKNRKVHLVGNAIVKMEDITITAGYILIDIKINEILASFEMLWRKTTGQSQWNIEQNNYKLAAKYPPLFALRIAALRSSCFENRLALKIDLQDHLNNQIIIRRVV